MYNVCHHTVNNLKQNYVIIYIYTKLLLDTKFYKRKDRQIKGMGERTGITII